MCHCRPAFTFRNYSHFFAVTGMTGNGGVNTSPGSGYFPVHNGQILPHNTLLFKLPCQIKVCMIIFGHYQEAWCIFIKAMDNPGTHFPAITDRSSQWYKRALTKVPSVWPPLMNNKAFSLLITISSRSRTEHQSSGSGCKSGSAGNCHLQHFPCMIPPYGSTIN